MNVNTFEFSFTSMENENGQLSRKFAPRGTLIIILVRATGTDAVELSRVRKFEGNVEITRQ